MIFQAILTEGGRYQRLYIISVARCFGIPSLQYVILNAIKISIITVVKNDCPALKMTCESIRSQKFNDYEHLIIDGASIDGSKEYLELNRSKQLHFISEEDEGVYDAMNKGLEMARGEWVLFMNSGDRFVDENSLVQWFSENDKDYDIIFCDVYRIYDSGKKVRWTQHYPQKYGLYRNICHQAILYNRQRLKNMGYDTQYRISADFQLLMRLTIQRKNFRIQKTNQCLVEYRMGGLSQQYAMQALHERFSIFISLISNRFLLIWNCMNLLRQIIRLRLTG